MNEKQKLLFSVILLLIDAKFVYKAHDQKYLSQIKLWISLKSKAFSYRLIQIEFSHRPTVFVFVD